MLDFRAIIGIVIFSAVETLWIALVLLGVGLNFNLTDNILLALAAFLVLVEEHVIAHNVGKGLGFPKYLRLPRKDR